jgi:hypothetical protein
LSSDTYLSAPKELNHQTSRTPALTQITADGLGLEDKERWLEANRAVARSTDLQVALAGAGAGLESLVVARKVNNVVEVSVKPIPGLFEGLALLCSESLVFELLHNLRQLSRNLLTLKKANHVVLL